MAHFQLESEINLALRLDTSLNVAPRKHGPTIPKSGKSGSNSSLSSSQLLVTAGQLLGGGGSNNQSLPGRSRSASRLLSPSRLLVAPCSRGGSVGNSGVRSASLNTSRSPSRSRPTLKDGESGGDSRSRTPSRGRTGTVGDRFIPNRSTCDMDAAHHSIVNSNNGLNIVSQSNSENNLNGTNVNQR